MHQQHRSRAGSLVAVAVLTLLALIGGNPGATVAAQSEPPVRPPRDTTGGAPINVTVTVTIKEGNATYDPATLPDDKKTDLKALSEGYATQFQTGDPDFFKGFRVDEFVNQMKGGLADIKKQTGEDAFHLPGLPIFTAFTASSVNSQPGGLGGVIVIQMSGLSIRVLPNNADQTLTDHENGHRGIFEYYYKTVEAQYLQMEILRVISTKHYATLAALEKDARQLAKALAPAFVTAVGDQNTYQETQPGSYDVLTGSGQNGDQNALAQQVQAAILAKAKASFPADF